ncbi:protein chibby homolog 1 isoform X2 [Corythoichthys intestinalis]|nr:protein chibby homolog 1 isoform X2 [Corythoichthys intestinalis]
MSLKLFENPFNPKKIPPRKTASLSSLHTLDRSTRELELGIECGPPAMSIGGHNLKFEDGQWISVSGGNASHREIERLKKKNLQLEEENNMLKLKIEILIDMLTESTVEYHLMEKEVEEIKCQH